MLLNEQYLKMNSFHKNILCQEFSLAWSNNNRLIFTVTFVLEVLKRYQSLVKEMNYLYKFKKKRNRRSIIGKLDFTFNTWLCII